MEGLREDFLEAYFFAPPYIQRGDVGSDCNNMQRVDFLLLDESSQLFASIVAVHYRHVAVQENELVLAPAVAGLADFLQSLDPVEGKIALSIDGLQEKS